MAEILRNSSTMSEKYQETFQKVESVDIVGTKYIVEHILTIHACKQ